MPSFCNLAGGFAAALNIDVREVKANINLLKGICEEAVEVLKTRPIVAASIRVFKRVSPVRQIEMAELMVSANNFSKGYAEALVMGTPKEHLVEPEKAKGSQIISPEEMARMEEEMESVTKEFKQREDTYGENMLQLTLTRRYILKLLDNGKVVRFLMTHEPDMLSEFQSIAAIESL